MSHRPLPHDLEAERAVLGSLLLDSRKLSDVADALRPHDFFLEANGTIYGQLLEAESNGLKADRLLLAKSAGVGAEYIAEILQSVPVAEHAIYYAKIVARKAAFRRLVLAGHEIQRLGVAEDGEPETAVDAAERLLRDAYRVHGREPVSAADAMVAVVEQVDRAKDRAAGYLTGLATFDRHFGGLFPGELVVLAARPGLGKTALACQIAHHFAARGRPVYFVSLEMTGVQLMLRMLCSQAHVSSKVVRAGNVSDGDADRLVQVSRELGSLPWYFHDAPQMTVEQIRRTARRLARKGLALVVIDYLQRITPRDRRVNRDQQVGEMSTALKALALELEVPVLCLVQLNREAERDSRPRLGHLRESGSIEADADVVAMLQRAEAERPDPDEPIRAELHIVKNRNGETGMIPLFWSPVRTTFEDG